MRRNTIIILAVIAVLIIVVIIVLLFLRSNTSSVPPPTETGSLPAVGTETGSSIGQIGNQGSGSGLPAGSTSQTSSSKFGVVFGEPVLNYFAAADNTVIAVEPDGKIAQIANGGSSYLSSAEIANVVSADFSYDGKKILVGFGGATSLQWSIFDVQTKAWTPLAVNAVSVAWAPNNYQIAYFAGNANSISLQTLDLGNPKAKPKVLFSLPNQDFMLLWPTTSTILISDRASALFAGSIFAFNLKTATLATVVQSRVGLEAKWNASGTTGIVLAGTNLGRGGQLGIIDGAGNFLHLLTFLTLPSKCVFVSRPAAASSTVTVPQLICGIPRDTSKLKASAIPDVYNEKIFMTSDGLYGVSLADGNVTTLFNDPAQNLDVSMLKFANNTLFFINRYDQKLYAFSIL